MNKTAALALKFIPLLVTLGLPSCSTVKTTLESKASEPTDFLAHAEQLEKMGARSPFLRTWTSPSEAQREMSATRTEIYIAPVDTSYLRPIGAKMAARQQRRWRRERPVERISGELHTAFVQAFKKSKAPHYQIVDSPTANSMTLELSLLELDPSSLSGNIVRKGATLKVGPVASLASVVTSGKIAIEGRLIDSTGKWPLFEFADREKDKMTFWTLRDFKPYGHSRVAIREWAKQFEETTRNPGWKEMGDARIWTLWPW